MKHTNKYYTWGRYDRVRYAFNRSASLVRLLFAFGLTRRGSKSRQESFDAMCDFMLHAGGVYTKFLQGVLLGVPEVRSWARRTKVDFFEQVPIENIDVSQMIVEELGSSAGRLRYWPKVLASGTFAQVYAGILDNDKEVVIKIQRYTIRPSLSTDVWLLRKFARFIKPYLTDLDADINSLTRDFSRMILAETDYRREARLAESFREAANKEYEDLVVPVTYAELCTEHILVQERLAGVSLAELLQNNPILTPEEQDAVRNIMSIVMLLPFTTGYVHADPHPGNIRLLGGRKVALLDFGALDDQPIDYQVYQRLLDSLVKAMDGVMTAAEALDAYFAAYAPRLHKAIEITSRSLDLPPILETFANFSMGSKANEQQAGFKGKFFALGEIHAFVNPDNRFMLKTTLKNISYARAFHTVAQTMKLFNMEEDVSAILRKTTDTLKSHDYSNDTYNLQVYEAKEIVFSWLEKVLERNPLIARDLFGTLRKLKSKN